MWRVSAYRRQGMSRPASAADPNPADGGRECPVLLAPLVRILLSLAVKLAYFQPFTLIWLVSAGPQACFSPFGAQFSVRYQRCSRLFVKFRCLASTTAGCRVKLCCPGWVIQVACVSFARFTAGSTLASDTRLLYTCGSP